MKIINGFHEIPADVLADIIHEYDTIYDDIVHEIELECESEGYPSRGSNFELRLDEYDYYFKDLWLSLCAKYGYTFRSQDDCI